MSTRPPKDSEASREAVRQLRSAAIVASMSWAEKIPVDIALAVVKWCERFDIDPVNEIDVLGNRPVPNGRYWQRQIAKGIRDGRVEWVAEHLCHVDARLTALADAGDEWARAEVVTRQRLRVMHGVPEEAEGACVVEVKLVESKRPLYGAQWAGGGTGRKIAAGGVVKTGRDADPIGETFPIESAITRAYGKVGRVAVPRDPATQRAMEAEAADLAAAIEVKAPAAAQEARDTAMVGRHALTSGDPYGNPFAAEAKVEEPEPVPVARNQAADAMRDNPPPVPSHAMQSAEEELAEDRRLADQDRA